MTATRVVHVELSSWSFVLPVDLPSANARIINSRATGHLYRKARNRYATMLHLEACRLGIPHDSQAGRVAPSVLTPFRHIHLERLWKARGRAWDDDNLAAAFKAFRDACQVARFTRSRPKGGLPRLVAGAGLVWDDSARWSRWSYAQERSGDGRPGVRVTVNEMVSS